MIFCILLILYLKTYIIYITDNQRNNKLLPAE